MITDKARAFYLVLLIMFLVVIGFFLLDYYQLIEADEIFPILKKKPSLVIWDKESPTEVEKLEVQKANEKAQLEMEQVDKEKGTLKSEQEKLEAEYEKLEQLRMSIHKREKELEDKEKERNSRERAIKILAEKIANMPPDNAVEMLTNWPDQDIIDVFKQMDKSAEQEGTQTITTYLLTLFKPDRRSIISNKWLDSETHKITPNLTDDFEKEVKSEPDLTRLPTTASTNSSPNNKDKEIEKSMEKDTDVDIETEIEEFNPNKKPEKSN